MFKIGSILIVGTIFLLFITTGHFMDSREVDEEVYTITLGIDKGVNNKVRVTVQYTNYKTSGGGEGGKDSSSQEGTLIDTIEAPTVLEGINMLGMIVSRRISLMHAKMLIISEELAREGIGDYISLLQRYREARGSMWIVVSKDSAEDFIIENKVTIGKNISKSIDLIFQQANYSNFFPQIKLEDFSKKMLSHYEQPYAVYAGINSLNNLVAKKNTGEPPLEVVTGLYPKELARKGRNKNEFVGMTIFDGDKMIGSFDNYETTYFLMIIGKFTAGIVSLEDKHAKGKAIAIDMRNGRDTVVKTRFEDGKPIIDVKVNIEADIHSIQSRYIYETVENIEELNKTIKEELLKGFNDTIKKSQKELNSDVFGFGKWIAGNFTTIEDWEKYNWLSHYKDAKINVELDVNIRRTGLLINSAKISSSKSD